MIKSSEGCFTAENTNIVDMLADLGVAINGIKQCMVEEGKLAESTADGMLLRVFMTALAAERDNHG